MDTQPLDSREAWSVVPLHELVTDIGGHRRLPRSWEHPAWRKEPPVAFTPQEPGRRHLVAWVGGRGTAAEPWVVEVSTRGRWPNMAELRGALLALTQPGAVFEFGFPFLAALPFEEIPPVLMVQVTAIPGSEAESRLKLSGGIVLNPNGKAAP